MKLSFNIISFITLLSLLSCKSFSGNNDNKKVKDSTLIIPVKNAYSPLDQSPMDMSYFPTDYPIEKMDKHTQTDKPVLRIIYSRPHKKGRLLFGTDSGSVCQYGKPWRLGANEATEISFFKPVVIGDKNIAAGTYTIYCIPQNDSWTIVLNTNLYTWGLHVDETKDVTRIQIPITKQTPEIEDLTMIFIPSPDGAHLLMTWGDVKAELPIIFS